MVPACRECNSTLNDILLPDVFDRRAYVHARYQKKYKRVLSMLYRTEEGLLELGPTLRLVVSRMQDEHDAVMRRLMWPTDPEYDSDAWENAWHPRDDERAPAEAGANRQTGNF